MLPSAKDEYPNSRQLMMIRTRLLTWPEIRPTIIVAVNAKIYNRMRRDQFAHERRNEAGDGDDRAPHNHPRTEPIELLTFVQHDLEARQPNGKQAEADVIHVRGGRTFQIRRIL